MIKHNKILSIIVVLVFLVTVLPISVGAIAPLPTSIPPTIGTPTYTSNTLERVTVTVRVDWHYYPYQGRTVKLQIGSSYYNMEYTSGSTYYGYYRKAVDLEPDTTYSYRVKATESWYDSFGFLKSASRTSSYYQIQSCNPVLSVQLLDITENSATFYYRVTSWGREGQLANPEVRFIFKHTESPYLCDVIDIDNTNFEGSYTCEGLALNNEYEYEIIASHVSYVYTLEDIKTGSFTTDDWTPNRKYAIILMINGDDDYQQEAHIRDYNSMVSALSGTGFTYINAKQYSREAGQYNLVSDLNYPNTASTPADSNSFVYIFLIGHGNQGGVYVGDRYFMPDTIDHYVSANDIDNVLDGLDYHKLVFISESCGSGEMADELGDDGRVIIGASNDQSWITLIDGNLHCIFSYYLIIKLDAQWSFFDSAYYAAQMTQGYVANQDPLFDDYGSHDGILIETAYLAISHDGQLANGLSLWT